MTSSCTDATLSFVGVADRREIRMGAPATTQDRIVERKTVTETSAAPHETIEEDYLTGAPHGDEEAAGAVGGAVGGVIVGAVVGGPVGAVVGGAIGAATGATAGAIDQKAKDDTVVVTREVRRP
jgi:uncharacterized protein YcfJ